MTAIDAGPIITGRGAVLSDDGVYRYELTREFTPRDRSGTVDLGRAAFMLCNPSTADHRFEDPTVRKCIGFAYRWGFSSIRIVNRGAYRANDPAELVRAHRRGWDVVGEHNAHHVAHALNDQLFVVAWGNAWPAALHALGVGTPAPTWADLDAAGPIGATEVSCLGRNANGSPRHPLMLAYSTQLEEYGP